VTSPDAGGRPSPPAAAGPPAPLTVAASLTGLEGGLLVLQGFTQVPGMHGEKLAMNVTTFLFFILYGAFLVFAAWQLYRLHSWARAPVVLAQLIQILVGASFWGGGTTIVAVVSIVLALVVLAGVFHPASLAALEQAD
jgi:hypothetical protein